MARMIAMGILWAEGIFGFLSALVRLVVAVCLGVLCLPVVLMVKMSRAQPRPIAPHAPRGDSEAMRAAKADALELAIKNNPHADPQWVLDRAVELN